MKKLKKILLINWLYFSKQVIEVEDINFITGLSGSGKSTFIDALQIVLLGETNARNFNRAANENSKRTLDGYLRAELDENSPHSRRGKDFSSYIACEFWDDVEGTQFVIGIVFDCRSDGNRQEQFFLYDGKIPENCFIKKGEAMDISTLRSFLKQNYGPRAKLYDSQKQYRTDMLAKWNVHNEQVTRMMKKAVSFRPISDIQSFITENICDIPEKPDIEAMQQNIRDYKKHEQLAQRQEEKLSALQEISKRFRELQQATDRWRQQSFLVMWSEKEVIAADIAMRKVEKQDCEAGIQEETAQIEDISTQITQKDQRKTELIAACAQSDVYQEETRLRTSRDTLRTEQRKLLEQLDNEALEIKREAVSLCDLCRTISDWPSNGLLSGLLDAADRMEKAYAAFLSCDRERFASPLALFEQAQQATAEFNTALRDAAYQVKALMDERNQAQAQKLAALENL
jgi:hypothetical protein